MAGKDLSKRIEELREEIRAHDYAYYVEGKPRISDAKYDELFETLKQLERDHPELVTPDSPTQKVGAPPREEFTKAEHLAPMLSLDSSKKPEAVREFLRRVRERAGDGVGYVVEPKLDGISVELVFDEGRFVRGVTRGDGRVGEDVTENMKTVRSLPLRLRPDAGAPARLAVRGEVILMKSEFQKLNRRLTEEGKETFANPRNAAAGAVRQLDPSVTASRPVDVFCYQVLALEGAEPFEAHWEALRWLRKAGLRVPDERKRVSSEDEILSFHADLAAQREDLDYEMDGVVIKVDRLELHEALGARQRNPRWAFAFKFEPRAETTRIRDIAVQVGRTGTLTPVALLDPVDVGGVTVSRASLHNEDIVKSLDARVGDAVRVRRAGDVIPEVTEVYKDRRRGKERPFRMPSRCPSCGAAVVREGAYVRCPAGPTCPAQQGQALLHWASRGAANIETLGRKKVEQILKKGLVKSVDDLYRLERDALASLEGWGEKSADNLLASLERSKRMPGDRFLYALGIRHVGERVARILAESFPSLDALAKASKEDLEAIDEIGPEIADAVVTFFSETRNRKLLERLERLGVRPVWPEHPAKGSALAGKTFVFTGSLPTLSRKEAKKKAESLGARAASSVSGNTDYVVAGENPGSKLDQAKALGVPVITEEAFLQMTGGP